MAQAKRGATNSTGTLSKGFVLLVATAVVAAAVAVTYFYFEAAVRHSTNYVWETLLRTGEHRLIILPLCVVLTILFFGAQHRFDPKSEARESHGLGSAPPASVHNFVKVLALGFLSLLAGASLGPEAILVPACIMIGAYTGTRVSGQNSSAVKLLSMVGFVSLMAAFFSSFIAGMLGLLLVTKQVKVKLNAVIVVVAALASFVTVEILKQLSSPAYTTLPKAHWTINLVSVVAIMCLLAAGYLTTYALRTAHQVFERVRTKLVSGRDNWLRQALIAAVGLSALYLLGGSLVEFTGNESIVPMLQRAASLGVIGLFWILLVKLAAISWSKSLGYRGGLVFPTVFAASVLVAIAQQCVSSVSFIIGLIAVMAGVILADRKANFLF